jgi:hypothetical protein
VVVAFGTPEGGSIVRAPTCAGNRASEGFLSFTKPIGVRERISIRKPVHGALIGGYLMPLRFHISVLSIVFLFGIIGIPATDFSTPTIVSLSPSTGSVGTSVRIIGGNFGST